MKAGSCKPAVCRFGHAAVVVAYLHAEQRKDCHEDAEQHRDVDHLAGGARECRENAVDALAVLDEPEEAEHAKEAERAEDGDVWRGCVLEDVGVLLRPRESDAQGEEEMSRR